MNFFYFSIFFVILSVLSKNIDFTKDLGLLQVKKSQEYLESNKDLENHFNWIYKEDVILYIILKGKVFNKNLCKKTLENRCLKLLQVIPSLKGVCNGDLLKKCEELRSLKSIIDQCREFEKELEHFSLKKNNCSIYIEKCRILESICSKNLNGKCNELMERCYRKEYDEVADIALLRALPNFTIELCESSIQAKCIELGKENDHMVLKCLEWKSTCQRLVKVSENINEYLKKSIKSIIEDVFGKIYKNGVENIQELKERCSQFLPECYLYASDFVNYPQNISKNDDLFGLCYRLQEMCRGLGIIVKSYNSFNPIESSTSLSIKIDLYGLYKKASESGIIVNRRMSGVEGYHLLALLIRNNVNIENKCIEIIKNNCSSIGYFHDDLRKMCLYYKNNNGDLLNCIILKNKLRNSCRNLNAELKRVLQFNSKDGDGSAMGNNYFLINDKDCKLLLSLCFYLKESCEDRYLDKLMCRNLTSICYHQARLRSSYNYITKLLRRNNHGSFDLMKKSNCTNKLINICRQSMYQYRGELFELCLSPEETCSELIKNIRRKCLLLKDELTSYYKDNIPFENCDVLGSSCKELSEHCIMDLGLLCYSFQKYCNEMKTTIELKNMLLQGRNNYLSNKSSCIERLNDFCINTIKEANTPFMGSCKRWRGTCEVIISSMKSHCNAFQNNFEKYSIANKIQNKDITFYDCKLWKPYCDIVKNNCEKYYFQQPCNSLDKICEGYYKTEFIELSLMRELSGYLKKREICMNGLNKRCKEWNQVNNKTFESQCKTLKKDQGLELCKKFENYMQKQCILLDSKLISLYALLITKEKLYKEKKNKVANFTKEVVGLNNDSFIKNFTGQNIYGDRLKRYINVFQDSVDLLDTEIQVMKDCNSTSEYLFKDDCANTQNIYKEIQNFCNSFRSHISKQSWLSTLPAFSTSNSSSITTSTPINSVFPIKETTTKTLISTESFSSIITQTKILSTTIIQTKTLPSTIIHTQNLTSTIIYTQFIKGWSTLTEKLTETITATITSISPTTFVFTTYFPLQSHKNPEKAPHNISYLSVLFFLFVIIILLCMFNFFLFLYRLFFIK
ncbi:hypothetical protein T552_02876 [Pneumocystis carinii B80]|uniref:Major surface glycoprotein 2 C-terminal domain-containing protein n=1 Tax=Pneumocystis carinii (strain B80) TaxID=1408658 RepID=A0A0W4ZDC9_PNEC8|nr:hypothetical protein T552_02876 [Pneumocystis carinii B80]KTW26395.1 hypothetical protein T552_02876 [Pneumocystis carinii B80]